MEPIKKRNTWIIKKHLPVQVHSQSINNYGVLLEILSRLPVKSLLRFICVCKNWKSLISSHHFRKVHREKHTSPPPLLIVSYNTLELANIPFQNALHLDKYNYLITSGLDGKIIEKIIVPLPLDYFYMTNPSYQSKLLCYINYKATETCLYNPSTRKTFPLTNPSSFSSPEFQRHYAAELGYIPSKDEYIMVHLFKLNNKLYCEVLNISISKDDIFKLHYNQWRSSIESSSIIIRSGVGAGVFVGGAFYWKAMSGQSPCDDMIISFDVETGCFSTFGVPQNYVTYHATLLELKGDIYLADYPEKPALLTLWKLSSDGHNIWTRYWEFDFKRLFGFSKGSRSDSSCFRSEIFIYRLKYLKGYDDQQVSAEMEEFRLEDEWNEMPRSSGVAIHTNLFTL